MILETKDKGFLYLHMLMLAFCQRLRPRAGLGAHSDLETATVSISYDFTGHLEGLSLNVPARRRFLGKWFPCLSFEEIFSLLWFESWVGAYDQFMYLCISTCFGLKTMPGEMCSILCLQNTGRFALLTFVPIEGCQL